MKKDFKEIKAVDIRKNIIKLFGTDWTLITAGDSSSYNTMTASWGGLGVLWNKDVCFIFVRPVRFTYEFTEKFNYFSLSFFTEKYRHALELCGTKSGRDGDKIKESGLTPMSFANYVSFKEADMIITCKKIYFQDINPEYFLDPEIHKVYDQYDYHRMYVGEIEKVYRKK